jgi:hypothetical protein
MTITELLVSSFISVIVLSASLGVYLAQHKHMIVQDQVSDMQHSIRASMEELSSKMRMAGYNVPTGINAINCFNADPDSIEIVYDSELLESVELSTDMASQTATMECSGDISKLNDDDELFIYDPGTMSGEFFTAGSVLHGSNQISPANALSKAYPTGSSLLRMNRFRYFIDNITDTDHPNLMVSYDGDSAQVYAENITDLQFQYVLSSGAIVDEPFLPEMIREVIIGITVRTEKEDDVQSYGYRTRELETTVKVRNLAVN